MYVLVYCLLFFIYGALIIIIIIITTTMFMVLSSWHSHCESSPGSFDECRLSAEWPPTLRPNQPIWAVSPPKDWLLPSADTIAIYSTLSIQFIFRYQNRHIKFIQSFIKQQSVTNCQCQLLSITWQRNFTVAGTLFKTAINAINRTIKSNQCKSKRIH